MTERLYYDDAYLRAFGATVTACAETDGGYAVRLDASAFYPTSGGQPYDTGRIGGARVLDVSVDADGDVLHTTDAPLTVGERVDCEIDWARRFDHMQQHAGEHMLAGAIYRMLGGYTIGLHLGADISTIDVELPGGAMRISDEMIAALETTVNQQIQADLPIRCFFPSPAEFAQLPLRKPPTVASHIRVVQIGDVECVACGGTHPSASGQIGLVKIVDARPSRGKMRVSFVCGMRAVSAFQTCAAAANAAAAQLSTGVEALPGAVEQLLARERELKYELRRCRADGAIARARALLEAATPRADGWRVVCAVLPGLDADGLREAASDLIGRGQVYALLASAPDETARLVFAASPGAPVAMGTLLAQAAKSAGGKGGGRADFAQGAAHGENVLAAARGVLDAASV